MNDRFTLAALVRRGGRAYMPISLLFFVLTGALFLAQASPFGVALMIFGAPLWSILLVNLGFAGVASEAAWTKRVNRAWLVLPLLWFGGNAVLAARDRLVMAKIRSEVADANLRGRTAFDPSRHALVFVGDGLGYPDRTPAWLVSQTNIPVVYEPNDRTPVGFVATRLVEKSACRTDHDAQIRITGFANDGDDRDERLDHRFCALWTPAAPHAPEVVATSRFEEVVRYGLPIKLVTTSIVMPDGKTTSVFAGHAALLPWLPRPVLGYSLNAGAGEWQRIAGFRRGPFKSLADEPRQRGEAWPLAKALGLTHVDAGTRRVSAPAAAPAKAPQP